MLLRRLLVPALLLAALAAPQSAGARGGGDDEVRTTATCASGAGAELRLRARDGEIELRFDLRGAPRGSAWRVVVSQERRIAWRGSLRARGGSGALRVERTLTDLAGADAIGVRASGPGGRSCRAEAVLQGD